MGGCGWPESVSPWPSPAATAPAAAAAAVSVSCRTVIPSERGGPAAARSSLRVNAPSELCCHVFVERWPAARVALRAVVGGALVRCLAGLGYDRLRINGT